MARWAATACVAVGLGIACGGSTAGGGAENPSTGGGPTEVTVSVVPAAATVHPGGSQQFSATVMHAADASVDWSIAEGSSGGAIDAKGLFTAGVTPGTFHVTARSRADPTKSAMATVVIPTPPIPTLIAVAVSPRKTTVEVGHATRFVATVTGTLDTDVVWSVVEGSAGGTIDASGAYTAPATTGTFHVAAASHADPSKTDSAEVTVVATPPPPPSVQVTISPTAVRLPTGASASFTAEVRNSADKDGTWSVAEGDAGGTITKAGVYTAPATAGVYHVVITAHADPTATARAEVTVLAPSPPPPQSNVVTITPQSLMMMARIPTQLDAWAFSATAPGSGQVDYSIAEGDAGGTFGSGGVYSPPYTPGTYHVVATSSDNPSLSATATVIVRPRGGTIAPAHPTNA